jgi:hypothetical protein
MSELLDNISRDSFKDANAGAQQEVSGDAENGTHACHIASYEVLNAVYQRGLTRGLMQKLSGGKEGSAVVLHKLIQDKSNLRIKPSSSNVGEKDEDGKTINRYNDRALDLKIIEAIQGSEQTLPKIAIKRFQRQLKKVLGWDNPELEGLRSSFKDAARNVKDADGVPIMKALPQRPKATSTVSKPDANSTTALHYKADGSLDMRFASSKAVEAGKIAAAQICTVAEKNDTLHFKKDGSLDMRFSSSKAAAATLGDAIVHIKADGTLDMRYASSKATATGGSVPGGSSPAKPPAPPPSSSSGLHYKADGTLDMRYASSKAAATGGSVYSIPQVHQSVSGGGGLHYKKDGTLDMRYSSSKGRR